MGAITDKELAKVIRSKVNELNKLLERMARMDVSVSIGTQSIIDHEVNENIKVLRIKVYDFSKVEKF